MAVQVTITTDNRVSGLTNMENNMKTMRVANIIEKDVILNMDETIAAEMEFYEQVLKKLALW